MFHSNLIRRNDEKSTGKKNVSEETRGRQRGNGKKGLPPNRRPLDVFRSHSSRSNAPESIIVKKGLSPSPCFSGEPPTQKWVTSPLNYA